MLIVPRLLSLPRALSVLKRSHFHISGIIAKKKETPACASLRSYRTVNKSDYSTVCTVQYSSTQYGTVQYSPVLSSCIDVLTVVANHQSNNRLPLLKDRQCEYKCKYDLSLRYVQQTARRVRPR